MMPLIHLFSPVRHPSHRHLAALGLVALLALTPLQSLRAAEPHADAEGHAAPAKTAPTKKSAPTEFSAKEIGDQVRDAVGGGEASKKRLTLIVNGKEKNLITLPKEMATPAAATKKAVEPPPAMAPAVAPVNPQASRQYIRARAAALTGHEAPVIAKNAHGHEVHWSYAGEGGPQTWGQLKPEFGTCATGRRQSPIHIEESITLQGPAEAIEFNYQPSKGTVVNNGHTIQIDDVVGDNSITVRGSTYKLLQFHFHHPAEERVNDKVYSMVAHLVHRNPEGQLAVVGVLLDPGVANSLINKVWTYMPLDTGDSVRMPAELVDLNELLPKDQRYYQFMGSLTTPPCSEGVLWMVLKQPVTLSREQLKLFGQLFPNNARPLQPVNNRPIRNAQ